MTSEAINLLVKHNKNIVKQSIFILVIGVLSLYNLAYPRKHKRLFKKNHGRDTNSLGK